ncbi:MULTISPECIES: MBL fold metallo-hydrolase [unclassified Halobacteriovorax]|uniref:MBL fold metallo-hydrolase n=1 Tax=unclassified Halobacteriovorax TaxID=2639665 RepID=UPI0039994CF7
MLITQVRNATILISYKENLILVDPMLANKGMLPRLRFFGSSVKNPTVELPETFHQQKGQITHALITHCQKGHFDHLDSAGRKFLRRKNIATFATQKDAKYLESKGIRSWPLEKKDKFFDGSIRQIPAKHVRGFLYPFLEHGVGYFIKLPNQPSLYLMGDTVLTPRIIEFIKQEQPDYIVAPTGVAQFDIGSPLLLPKKDIKKLIEISTGTIIANHMDALDHCRLSRRELKELIGKEASKRVIIPEDGETIKLN